MRSGKKENLFLKYAVLFLMVAIFFAFIYRFIGMYYGINDDTTMMKIVSGKYNGTPDGHAVFLKYALGNILASLYKWIGNIDWYGLFEVFCMFVSYIAIIFALFDSTKEKNNKLFSRTLGILILILITLQYVILFQFTTVAGTTCAAALFLIAVNKEKEGVGYLILEFFLLIAAYLIRRKVLYLTIPFFFIIFLSNIFEPNGKDDKIFSNLVERLKSRKVKAIGYAVIIVVMILSAVSIEIIEDKAYSTSDWNEYRQYKSYRATIVDYKGFPTYEGNEEFWGSIDVTKEERDILSQNFGILPDIDYKDLKAISEYGSTNSRIGYREALSLILDKFIYNGGIVVKIVVPLVFLTTLIYLFRRDVSKFNKLKLIGLCCVFVVELFYIALQGRLPARISYVLVALLASSVFGSILRIDKKISFGEDDMFLKKIILLFGICVVLFANIISFDLIDNEVREYEKELQSFEDFSVELQKEPDKLFIISTGSVASRQRFLIHDDSSKLNSLGTKGWSSTMPLLKEYEKSYGLDTSVIPFVQDNVYYVVVNLEDAVLMETYLNSIGYDVSFEMERLILVDGYSDIKVMKVINN